MSFGAVRCPGGRPTRSDVNHSERSGAGVIGRPTTRQVASPTQDLPRFNAPWADCPAYRSPPRERPTAAQPVRLASRHPVPGVSCPRPGGCALPQAGLRVDGTPADVCPVAPGHHPEFWRVSACSLRPCAKGYARSRILGYGYSGVMAGRYPARVGIRRSPFSVNVNPWVYESPKSANWRAWLMGCRLTDPRRWHWPTRLSSLSRGSASYL